MADLLNLHPVLRTALDELLRAARGWGLRVIVTSGYRDPRKQKDLYRRYLAGLMPYVVAVPGRSTHEYGLAVDLSEQTGRQAELVALAMAHGWFWAGPRDPVHFQGVSQADWSAWLAERARMA